MKKNNLQILHIIWWGEIGGIAFNLLDQVAHFKNSHQLTICILGRDSGPLTGLLENYEVSIVQMRATSGLDIFAFIRLLRFIRKHKFDIVHNHIPSYFSTIALLIGGRSARRIFQEHGGLQKPDLKQFTTLFYRLFTLAYDKFIAVSDDIAKSMINVGVPEEKIRIIYNPVDVMKFNSDLSREKAKKILGLPEGFSVIGTACRFAPEKNLKLFLEAAKSIYLSLKNICFVMVGDGKEKGELVNLANEYGLVNAVYFTGVRTDMYNVWRAFDIYLFTSSHESFGRTLLESQACETPVVAALPLTGGATDIIKSSPAIIYVTDRNASHLAESAIHLLNSTKKREHMGRLGRAWVMERFDVKNWVNQLESLYISLCS